MELRERGRRAFDRGEWRGSYEHLSAAVADDALLEPGDLERLAVAAYLTGRDGESTHAWTRAYQRWLDLGAYEHAVRCALWAGFGLVQREEVAQGGGWLARAGTLVEQHGLDGVERGYLLLPEALTSMGSGDLEGALDRFDQAARLPVTARELAVLRLVAAGKTNREIAAALSISDRTVERHLSNIFTRRDVPNRAAATAYAYDHDLV